MWLFTICSSTDQIFDFFIHKPGPSDFDSGLYKTRGNYCIFFNNCRGSYYVDNNDALKENLQNGISREIYIFCLLVFQSWNALCYVTKTLDTTELHNYVNDIRQAVRFAVADLKYHQHQTSDLMPGFCLPKGITPILPIFRWVVSLFYMHILAKNLSIK